MKKLLSKEVIIGFCVILALAILFFGIEYLKGISVFKPANYYYAVYDDVKGLAVSAPVNVNGVKIGQVDEVEIMYDRPGKVLVQFSIDRAFHLPVDSKAEIDCDLLGTATLRLDIASNPNYYHSGDTIPGTVNSGFMDKVSNDLMPGVADIVPKIDSLMVNLNRLTSSPALLASLENLEAVTKSLRTTVALLNTSAAKLPAVMGDVQGVVSNVDSISVNLTTLTANLANAPIEETIANFGKISAELAAITAQINNPDSNLGQLLYGTELYDNLVRSTADIDSLLVDIKKNPKRYISIKLL